MRRLAFSGLLVLCLLGCGDSVPVPDRFDAAFATGQFCIPSAIATGGSNTHYPVRFVYNLYDCVGIVPGTVMMRTVFSGQQMVMLATAELAKDTTVEQTLGCDARNLENPPEGRYQTITQDFTVSLPRYRNDTPSTDDDMFATGPFVVALPYLTLEQGQRVIDRIDAGEDPILVIQQEVGQQNYPSRQVAVNFSETATPVASAAEIPAADCHSIPVP
jgi:hypothetical protein